MLNNPDGAVKTCRTATFPGGTFELQRATIHGKRATSAWLKPTAREDRQWCFY